MIFCFDVDVDFATESTACLNNNYYDGCEMHVFNAYSSLDPVELIDKVCDYSAINLRAIYLCESVWLRHSPDNNLCDLFPFLSF